MWTLFKIAWRNCWRSRTRTLIVISSIVVGIWGSLAFMGFMDGLMNQRLQSAIDNTWSDIQIQSQTYAFDKDISNDVSGLDQVLALLEKDTQVVAYTDRFETEALVQTAREQRGAKILGVNASREKRTLQLAHKVIDGEFFGEQYTRPALIGKKMAENLNVEVGSKILVTFTNLDSSQVAENYRVSGIYQSGNTAYDEYNIFVPKKSIIKLTGVNMAHQIMVKTKLHSNVDSVKTELQSKIPHGNIVNTWRDSDPMLAYGADMYDTMLLVIMVIIIAGLLFGIINTIVMSILERKREIGVLLAVGMKPLKIKLMIAAESMYYGLVGGPVGVLLGFLFITYFHYNGLDLSNYSEGMMEYGLDPIIYFDLPVRYYFIYGGLITLAAFLGGLYPARIATKQNPIDSLRSI